MRFIFRWIFRLLILALVLTVALVLLKDVLIKGYVEHRVRARTGLEFQCSRLEVGLFSPTVDAEGVKVYRPAEVGGALFLDVPDLHVECDPAALVLWRLHLKAARVSVAEMNLLESKEPSSQAGGAPASSPANRTANWLPLTFTGIDTLNLSFGKLTYTNLKEPNKRTEVNVGMSNQVLYNVKSVADLTNFVMQAALRHGLSITEEPVKHPKPARKAPPR